MSNSSKCSRYQAPKPRGGDCKYNCEEFAQPHERHRKRAMAARARRIAGEQIGLGRAAAAAGAARAMARK